MALNLGAVGKRLGPISSEYSWRDIVLYALGVGAGYDELEYVYENQLKVIPSFAILSIYDFFMDFMTTSGVNLAGIGYLPFWAPDAAAGIEQEDIAAKMAGDLFGGRNWRGGGVAGAARDGARYGSSGRRGRAGHEQRGGDPQRADERRHDA